MKGISSRILDNCHKYERDNVKPAKTLALTDEQLIELAGWLKDQPWFSGATKTLSKIVEDIVGGQVYGLTVLERDKMIVVDE